MKRGGGGYDGLPNKRVKPANEEIRVLIQSKAAGSVIGKGGQNISKLRSDYKASITVPDCPGPERILTISADEEAMMEVIRELIPHLEDAKQHGRGGGDGESCELRVLIHQSQVGAVIGKGGARIKELREETGANVKIYSSCCPNSTDRIMQISGKPDLCVDCLRKITDILKDSMPKGPYDPYDPHNFDEMYASEYGGYGDPSRGSRQAPWASQGPWMSGPPGGGGPSGGFGSGRMGPPGRGSMNGGYGGPPGRSFGSGRVDNGFGGGAGRGYRDNYGPSGRGGFGGGSGGGGPWGSRGSGGSDFKLGFSDQNDDWGETKSQVTIPQNLAGAIIGKGGARIRKIRSDSGANITIEDPSTGSNDRIITITGSQQSIQMAQYLLQQSVREHASASRY